MVFPQILLLVVGCFMVIGGILLLDDNRIRSFLKFSNSLRGTQTKITDATVAAQKIMNTVAIIIGIVLVIVSLVLPSLLHQ